MYVVKTRNKSQLDLKFPYLQTIQECYNCFEGFPYSKDNETVQLQNFQQFLINDQNDPLGKDDRVVSNFLRDFVQDPLRDVQEPYLTIPEVTPPTYQKQNFLAFTQISFRTVHRLPLLETKQHMGLASRQSVHGHEKTAVALLDFVVTQHLPDGRSIF